MNAIEGDDVESSELFFTEDVRDSDLTENVTTTSKVDVTMAIDTSSWRAEEDDIGNVALLGSESQDATLSIFHGDDDDSEDVVVLY
uniref:Uncharacterized protein n=1 Tax=Caenorhabditis japonica TaxID=281687 RepID=A0A8R1EJV9_CAEJA